MSNKSGYFTDSEGNHLLGATLGENVFLTDGTDLETKLNNLTIRNSYGYNEIICGDFFGNPLYRRCFILNNVTVPQNGSWSKQMSELISDSVRVIRFSAIGHVGSQFVILPYTYSSSSLAKYTTDISVDNNAIVLTRGDSNSITFSDLTLVLEYIK